MAMLLFKGEALTVRATHNVISEFIRLNETSFMEVMKLSGKDPIGWTRDMVYCSLRVYNPKLLIVHNDDGSSKMMSNYDVGDILFDLPVEETTDLMKSLLDDFIILLNGKSSNKEVASEKK